MYDPMGFEVQPDWYSCGACAFAHAALALGTTISLDDAKRKCRTVPTSDAVKLGLYTAPLLLSDTKRWYHSVMNKAGTNPRPIMGAIARHGWKYKEFHSHNRTSAKRFLDLHLTKGHPIILSVDDAEHYLTVAGIVDGKYVVIDSGIDSSIDVIEQYTFHRLIENRWYVKCEHCEGNGCKRCSQEGYNYYAIAVIADKAASTNLLRWLPREIKRLIRDKMLQEYWGYYLQDLKNCFKDRGVNTEIVHKFLTDRKNNILSAVSDSLLFWDQKTVTTELNNYITVSRSYGLKYQVKCESAFYAYFIAAFIGTLIDGYGI